jgi:hypothetical protein
MKQTIATQPSTPRLLIIIAIVTVIVPPTPPPLPTAAAIPPLIPTLPENQSLNPPRPQPSAIVPIPPKTTALAFPIRRSQIQTPPSTCLTGSTRRADCFHAGTMIRWSMGWSNCSVGSIGCLFRVPSFSCLFGLCFPVSVTVGWLSDLFLL